MPRNGCLLLHPHSPPLRGQALTLPRGRGKPWRCGIASHSLAIYSFCMLVYLTGRYHWIPACAGMTGRDRSLPQVPQIRSVVDEQVNVGRFQVYHLAVPSAEPVRKPGEPNCHDPLGENLPAGARHRAPCRSGKPGRGFRGQHIGLPLRHRQACGALRPFRPTVPPPPITPRLC